MGFVLGMDGGGTKTNAVVADKSGKVIAKATAGPTNPNSVDDVTLSMTLNELFLSLEKQIPSEYKEISHIFAGVAGTGNEDNRIYFQKKVTSFFSDQLKVQVKADTVNALYSGTYGSPGIVQIAGTGSIAYGINHKSETERVSGWGYLLGDEGSGFDIGKQGVVAALRAYDGRGPATSILQMLYNHFEVDLPHKLIQKIYGAACPKDEISPLSKIVFQAYKQGDAVAEKILNEAVSELVLNIRTLYGKLFAHDHQVSVVLVGGIFNEKHIIPKLIDEQLKGNKAFNLVMPVMAPVGGSVIGAFLMEQLPLNENIINNLIQSFQRKQV
ncbi:N-acetylglucosamine kinase [Virgibacillus ainsalahensis]